MAATTRDPRAGGWPIAVQLALLVLVLGFASCSSNQPPTAQTGPATNANRTEEFGMTEGERRASISAVEAAVALCMDDRGWEYTPVDADDFLDTMATIHTAPGLSDEEYLAEYGYGLTTQPFQEAGARVFGENAALMRDLDTTERAEYETALLGPSTRVPAPTFLTALDAEDLSSTGGCTRLAVEQVFEPRQLTGRYLNPVDEKVQTDPRVVGALVAWADCMDRAGYPAFDQETAERDLQTRLGQILAGRRDLAALSDNETQKLLALQAEERAVAMSDAECADEHVGAVVDEVELEVTGVEPD